MARSKSRRRDVITIANQRLPPSTPNYVSPSYKPTFPKSLRLYEDRRTFHPDPNPSAISFNRSRHRLTLVDREKNFSARSARSTISNRDRFAGLRKFPSQTKAIIAFDAPENVLVCVRRKMRKEVLHAYKKAGKRGQRRPRYNQFSKISCKKRR